MESGSMHIVCPHCTTSYAINLATLGEAGRTVRCARCKETWLARPEDAIEAAVQPAMAEAGHSAGQRDLASEWNEAVGGSEQAPVVESPSIANDWQDDASSTDKDDWIAMVRDAAPEEEPQRAGWFGRFLKRKPRQERSASRRRFGSLSTACAAMGALVVALIVWRADVVRLAPQTAGFYRLVGLNVNLRGLAFRDVKVTTETVEGKPVLVIEGVIVGESKKTVDLPRLRFSVRDAQGAEIYAWNSVLEQTTLNPGEHASFRSRLASPPAQGKSIDVRFFNKHDISGGSI
jgi:predicted Zn finger-like uncharacterized protein